MRNVSRWTAIALAVCASAIIASCGKSLESKVVGQYKGEVKMPAAKAGDQSNAAALQVANAMAGMLTLEVKKDKTFSMKMADIPIEGKWEIDGSMLVLTMEKYMGQSAADLKKMGSLPSANGMDKPLQFTVSDDGNTLTRAADQASDQGSMVFARQKS